MVTTITAVPYPYTEVTRTNFCTNPSFEVDTGGWVVAGGAAPTLLRPPVVGRKPAGDSCARLTATAAAGTMVLAESAYRTAVVAGATWTVSAFVRGTPGRTVQARISWSGGPGGTVLGAAVTLADTWQQVSVTAVVPAGVTALAGAVVVAATGVVVGTVCDVDAVLIENALTAGSYFDGSSADAAGLRHTWYAGAHASGSYETVRTPTANTDSITPAKFTLWESARERMVTAHPVLGSDEVDVTIASGLSLRSGTFEAYFADEASAIAFEDLVSSDALMISDSDRPPAAGMYVVVSRIRPRMLRDQQYVVSAEWLQTMLDGSAW